MPTPEEIAYEQEQAAAHALHESLKPLRAQLRIDDCDEDDAFLSQKKRAAESWIAAYLGVELATFNPLPAAISEAVLQLSAHLFEHSGSGLLDQTDNYKELPFGIVDLIRPWRAWEF